MVVIDIAVGLFPGQDARGDYALVDFLLHQGRIFASGFPTYAAVQQWVADNPPATVAWRWREGLYVDDGNGRVIEWSELVDQTVA